MNGETSTNFTIGVIGFERAECRVLQRVIRLSEYRQPTFGPFNKERDRYPHVVVVNADQRSAIDKWNGFRRANAHRASFAPIFVSRHPTDLPCPGPYVLYRPFLTTQLFSVLDQVVTEVHGYRPDTTADTASRLVALTPVEKEQTSETPTQARNAVPTSQTSQTSSISQSQTSQTSDAAQSLRSSHVPQTSGPSQHSRAAQITGPSQPSQAAQTSQPFQTSQPSEPAQTSQTSRTSQPSQHERLSYPDAPHPRESSPTAQPAALMIHDNLSARTRLHLREALSPIASRVDFAESGDLAQKLIDTYAYSVILIDSLLPNDDPYDICAQIKHHPLQQQASTVMLTSNPSPAERVMGTLAGFDNFLAKPIRPEAIQDLATELARPAPAI